MRWVKAFVFDLDGTLVNTSGSVLESVNYALAPWKIELDYKDIEKIRDRVSNTLFDGFGLTCEEQEHAFERIRDYTLKNLSNNKLFDGIAELLQFLNDRGYKMAIWTGRDSESAGLLVKELKIDSFFKVVVGNSDIANNKPHSEGLLKALSLLGVHPANAVMIGDHDHDLVGAKGIGASSIRVDWSESPNFHQGTITPDISFSCPYKLKDWIEQWSLN